MSTTELVYVLGNNNARGVHRFVLLLVADEADLQGVARIPLERLVRKSNMPEAEVRASLAELERVGELHVEVELLTSTDWVYKLTMTGYQRANQ